MSNTPEFIDDAEWLPKTGFLRRYMQWTKTQESPAVFHFWTALTVLAAAVSRRWFTNKGFYNVYCPLYTLLIAPTGRCRKSRCTAIGMSLIDSLDLRRISTKITPEALVHVLRSIHVATNGNGNGGGVTISHKAEGFIYASELTVFLGKQSYNEGLIDLLTDLADAPSYWSNTTKGMGRQELRNVALTLLACSTAEWLGDAIPQRAFGGGFLGRIIFVCQQQTPRFFALPRAQDPSIKAELVAFLDKVRHSSGEYVFTPDGEQWHEEWYKANRDKVGDLRLNGYYERKPEHLLRVAMLMGIAEEAPPLFTPELLGRAADVLSAIEPGMSDAMREINITAHGRDSNRVLSAIGSQRHGCSYEDVVKQVLPFMSSRICDEVLKGLVVSGRVIQTTTISGRHYRIPQYAGEGKAKQRQVYLETEED